MSFFNVICMHIIKTAYHYFLQTYPLSSASPDSTRVLNVWRPRPRLLFLLGPNVKGSQHSSCADFAETEVTSIKLLNSFADPVAHRPICQDSDSFQPQCLALQPSKLPLLGTQPLLLPRPPKELPDQFANCLKDLPSKFAILERRGGRGGRERDRMDKKTKINPN